MKVLCRRVIAGCPLEEIIEIAKENFSGLQQSAPVWVHANFKAWPRMQYFVATKEGDSHDLVLAYALWVEKGGFRKESVWELEQIATRREAQGNGIGSQLITESREMIRKHLHHQGRWLKIVEVTTGTDNQAQRLYEKTLEAKVEATIRDLYRGDEVIMVARYKKD